LVVLHNITSQSTDVLTKVTLLAEAGKVKSQYEAGGQEPGKFKLIEIPWEHDTEPVVSTGQ
jgi:hypothetical protein